MLGVDSLDEIARYLGHEQWRLRDCAHRLSVDLVKQGGGARLMEVYQESQAREVDVIGNFHAAAVLSVLADAEHKSALGLTRSAMSHTDPRIRRSAVQALFAIGGDDELSTVLKFMVKATHPHDLEGCEKAMLSRRDDPAHVKRLSSAIVKILPKVSSPVRRSMAYVIGQFGGEANFEAIASQLVNADDPEDRQAMVVALAYAPDRHADGVMLALLEEDAEIAEVVASRMVHRMVGPEGMSSVSDEHRLMLTRKSAGCDAGAEGDPVPRQNS